MSLPISMMKAWTAYQVKDTLRALLPANTKSTLPYKPGAALKACFFYFLLNSFLYMEIKILCEKR